MWWNKYLGNDFAERGRGPDTFDCWGKLMLIYEKERGILLPSYIEHYESTNDREKIGETIFRERQERWVQVEQPKEFDAILLKMRGVPMHVGIVTKPGYMIHCERGVGTVHEKYDAMRWANKITGFFRYE